MFAPSSGQCQTEGAPQAGWRFAASEQVDLWYHGLALVGFRGFAPMPMYDRDYLTHMRAAKRQAGVATTALDSLAADFRAAFERDSVFELLHFVPLYFVPAEPEQMLASVESAASGRASGTFGASVVASVIQGRERQQLLARFVSALRDEWERFYGGHWRKGRAERAATLAAAQERWDREVEPALLTFLADQELAGGTAFVAGAVGGEGRIFARGPDHAVDNLAAVQQGATPGSPALALLRELCYPLVSRLVARLELGGVDRVLSERISSRGAVRCGALLIDRYAPTLSEEYRELYLSSLPSEGIAFDQAFGVPSGLMVEMRRALRLQ